AVVGAGAAGLVAAKELLAEGHRVTVFEQGPVLGGTWVYTPKSDEASRPSPGPGVAEGRVYTSMYRDLRTNLPREVMSFLDFPFLPDAMGGRSHDTRRFCSHSEVLAYLEAFTDAFSLRHHIQYDTTVTLAEPLPAGHENGLTDAAAVSSNGQRAEANGHTSHGNGQAACEDLPWPRWRLSLRQAQRKGSKQRHVSTQDFDALLVCNGHYTDARWPEVAGQEAFPGRISHSHNYREPSSYKGQRVVCVGASASGTDISREIASTADEVYLCERGWDGDVQSHPAAGPRGNIHKRPGLISLRSDGRAEFEDGSFSQPVDAVLFCTGYLYSVPFLSTSAVVGCDASQSSIEPLYRHLFPPTAAPTLALLALPWRVVPFPLAQLQARWVARVLSGKVAPPTHEELRADSAAFYKEQQEEGRRSRDAHYLGEHQWGYNEWLARSCGEPADIASTPWRIAMNNQASMGRRAAPEDYRDRDDTIDAKAISAAHADFASLKVPFLRELQA
ncbi:hypothetical protein WJX84_002278, partial [Apatococcus fuscideae]